MSITINIVSFRYGHLAAHSIESVLSQTLRPDIVRFFDDGAGDCGHLHHLYPDVEIVERPKNLGIVASFNDALFRTKTDRILMLGADNYLRPDALAEMTKAKADIVSSDIAIFGEKVSAFALAVQAEAGDGYPIWRFRGGDLARGNYIHGSSLYNTDAAKAARGYSASGGRNSEEDWILWRRMIAAGGIHKHIAQPLLFYRRHGANFQPNA